MRFRLERAGYRSLEVEGEVTEMGLLLNGEMEEYRPPYRGTEWVDAYGAVYQPDDDHHVSKYYVGEEDGYGCQSGV